MLFGWWFGPFGQLGIHGGQSRIQPNIFDVQGIAPIGYTLFAFALGTAAGTFIRRTVPAMAVAGLAARAVPCAAAPTSASEPASTALAAAATGLLLARRRPPSCSFRIQSSSYAWSRHCCRAVSGDARSQKQTASVMPETPEPILRAGTHR